ncbi:expressed unknown protein [Seminavis robusta]|uniref:RNI-like protein n=1 Tax=Seminavis robusta TaxID=568900 RepID=A0A9N8HIS0_9STRA|nr:expressed unknown protein [Seminavis robusta]|eukprot:Sro516_g158420.1 n/a (450) ;mRNA; f:4635-5984
MTPMLSDTINNDANNDDELTLILNRKNAVQIQLQNMTFDYPRWTEALDQNRTLVHVTIAVSLRALATNPTVLQFFRAIGKLPRLQKLEFRGGTSCCHWRFPWQILTKGCLLLHDDVQHDDNESSNEQHQQSVLHTLHIQDVEFSSGKHQEEITELAQCISSLPSLKKLTLAHCRLEQNYQNYRAGSTTLDPLFHAILTSPTLEKVIVSATRVHALGGAVSKQTLRQVFASHQQMQQPMALQELRLLQFDFVPDILTALLGTLLRQHAQFKSLFLSSCQWDRTSLRLLAQFLIQSSDNLKELQLLGTDLNNLLHDSSLVECHVELADALASSSLWTFLVRELYPWKKKKRNHDDEKELELTLVAQQAYLTMIQTHNYHLQEFCMVQQFAPQPQGLMEFYLRLNRAGRHDAENSDHKQAWVNAVAAVNDSVACIFFFLSRNPSLCNEALLE